MPRSVTRNLFVVGVPLVALASVGILGSRPAQHSTVAAHAPAGARVAIFQPRTIGPDEFNRLADGLPRPTPEPIPTPAPPVAPAQPVAAAPRPVVPAVPRPQPPPPPPAAGVGGAAGVEFNLVNQDRAANGVAPLAYSGALARVAQYRAQDMLNRGYFSHYDPATGQLAFVQLMRLWGIGYSTAGENIAWSTNPSMANINVMFMNSPEHRDNILKGAYHRAGIGVASSGAKTMVVEVFSN